MNYDDLISAATDVGYLLLRNGAEIYRVEDSMQRIFRAYGVETGEVFAIPTCIFVTITTPEGKSITKIKRLYTRGTDLDKVDPVSYTHLDVYKRQRLEDVIASLHDTFESELTQEKMEGRLNQFVQYDFNPVARIAPLVVKDFVMRIGYDLSTSKETAAISNVGKIDMPPELRE